jgi:hypothetical protein
MSLTIHLRRRKMKAVQTNPLPPSRKNRNLEKASKLILLQVMNQLNHQELENRTSII